MPCRTRPRKGFGIKRFHLDDQDIYFRVAQSKAPGDGRPTHFTHTHVTYTYIQGETHETALIGVVRTIGGADSGAGQLRSPWDVAVDGEGNVLVAVLRTLAATASLSFPQRGRWFGPLGRGS